MYIWQACKCTLIVLAALQINANATSCDLPQALLCLLTLFIAKLPATKPLRCRCSRRRISCHWSDLCLLRAAMLSLFSLIEADFFLLFGRVYLCAKLKSRCEEKNGVSVDWSKTTDCRHRFFFAAD